MDPEEQLLVDASLAVMERLDDTDPQLEWDDRLDGVLTRLLLDGQGSTVRVARDMGAVCWLDHRGQEDGLAADGRTAAQVAAVLVDAMDGLDENPLAAQLLHRWTLLGLGVLAGR